VLLLTEALVGERRRERVTRRRWIPWRRRSPGSLLSKEEASRG